jgi:tetratricopeptide (TPR) repeat protein
LDVQVQDVASGKVLSADSVRGEDVFPLVDELTGRIRASLDVADRPAGRPLAEVVTPSLEAYQFFSEGLEAHQNLRHGDAQRLYERAVEIDPSFAMALFELSRLAENWGQTARSTEYRQKVLEQMDRLPERQRLLVEAAYTEAEGRPEQAIELLEDLVIRYPDEEEAWDRLQRFYRRVNRPEKALEAAARGVEAVPQSGPLRNSYGYELMRWGRYPEALRELETYAELVPNEPNPYDSLAEAYLITGQPEEALETYARPLELDPDWWIAHVGRFWSLAMLGRYEEALTELPKATEIITRQGFPLTFIHFMEAFALSRTGRYRDAREHIVQGVELAKSLESSRDFVELQLLEGLMAIETGDPARALQSIRLADELIPKIERVDIRQSWTVLSQLLAGVAEIHQGQVEKARTHLASQEAIYSERNTYETFWYYALAGEIALATGDLAAAETAFSNAEPELKMFFNAGTAIISLFGNDLSFRDGPARVKKAQGDLPGAIRIYRKLLKPDIGSKWTAMLEPRYVLALARLLDETGDKEAARAEYERFLELWKNADEGLPELKEARAYVGQ